MINSGNINCGKEGVTPYCFPAEPGPDHILAAALDPVSCPSHSYPIPGVRSLSFLVFLKLLFPVKQFLI